jgi:hypothetical protein
MHADTDDLVTEAEAQHTRTAEDELPGDGEQDACWSLTCFAGSDSDW